MTVSRMRFAARGELGGYEWDNQRKEWRRPSVEREVLKRLSKRSTADGLARIAYFAFLQAAPAVAAVYIGQISMWLTIPVLYVYYYLYGFWVAIAHELQHRTAFAESADWFSEIIFFIVQALMWNSPTYARISHRLHHRYTMVRGVDPETDWPEVITTKWLREFVLGLVLKILVVGAVIDLYSSIRTQIERTAGKMNGMVRDHCTERDIAAIRIESLALLVFHGAVAATAAAFRAWELLACVTIAWQIGSPIEVLWHATEHIGRPYNVNDHRLNTRSIRVSRFTKSIFWGLDDHVDHHLYPIVPSRNLPKLHGILEKYLPIPGNVFGCWAEMFEIAKEKDRDPRREFVSVATREIAPGAVGDQTTDEL
jgi:fatty acid desaturase